MKLNDTQPSFMEPNVVIVSEQAIGVCYYDRKTRSASEDSTSHLDSTNEFADTATSISTLRSSSLIVTNISADEIFANEFPPKDRFAQIITFETEQFQDVCDGRIDGGLDVKLSDKDGSRNWVPQSLVENAILEAKSGIPTHSTLIWNLAGSTTLFLIGFKHNDSGKMYYVNVFGEGALRVSSQGKLPENLTESDASQDTRVFKYFKSNKSDGYVMQSAKHSNFFVVLDSGYVKAQKIEEKYATTWAIVPK